MRYLQGLNWVLMAASFVMMLTLGVVCLLFWIYREEPIMQASFPELLKQTGIFTWMTIISSAAALSLYKRITGYWLLQIALAISVAATVNFYLPG